MSSRLVESRHANVSTMLKFHSTRQDWHQKSFQLRNFQKSIKQHRSAVDLEVVFSLNLSPSALLLMVDKSPVGFDKDPDDIAGFGLFALLLKNRLMIFIQFHLASISFFTRPYSITFLKASNSANWLQFSFNGALFFGLTHHYCMLLHHEKGHEKLSASQPTCVIMMNEHVWTCFKFHISKFHTFKFFLLIVKKVHLTNHVSSVRQV